MKKALTLFLAVFTSISFAANNCSESVEEQYLDNARGTRFDYMPSIRFKQILLAGEVFEIRRHDDVGPFDADKLIFTVTGSIHSGWFSDAIVVEPHTCEIERIQEIASE